MIINYSKNGPNHENRTILTQKNTQIVLLGTGTPNPDPMRFGSSIAIVVGNTPYLIDFGPGVVRRVAAAYNKGISALTMPNLKIAFLTHLHSDHTAGFPDLILTPWVLERNEPLQVYGPLGTQAMTDNILAAYQQDIHERVHGLEPANPHGYKVKVTEVEAGIIYQDSNITVDAFPVNHGSWQAFGFKFTTPDKTIVISGDTTPVDILVEKAQDCDVLIHEVYSVKGFQTRPTEWQKYHAAVHTSSHQLAQIANKAQPNLLILYHQLFWGVSESDLLTEIQESYSGHVVSGNDLDVFE